MNCFVKTNEKEMRNIINDQALYIIKINEQLQLYKNFHDEILNNEAIQKKFSEYEKTINDLKNEIYNLKNSSN
tara:strand:- start:147 stop:365 length:219 start_codon:yes stop_codon:yes gene_type:complete